MKIVFYLIFMVAALLLFFYCSPSLKDEPIDGELGGTPEKPEHVSPTKVPEPKEGTIYGTWVNVWVSSSETWWGEQDYHGLTTIFPDGTWKALNWNDYKYRKIAYQKIIEAGIDFIVTDNTNYTTAQTDKIVSDFTEDSNIDLKFCVALGDAQLQSTNVMDKWLPNITKHSHYLKINEKPVIVCYVSKNVWDNNYNNDVAVSKYKDYYKVWASGENTAPNKWGWQVEPEDGLVDSDFAAFPTPSVKQQPTTGERSWWSKSIAMLDYTFWQTRIFAPQYVIASSYDDCSERNGWLPLKTGAAREDSNNYTPASTVQMFDPWTGKIADPYVFYNRMKSWVKGEELYHIDGGILSDGIYRIKNKSGVYIQADSDYMKSNMVYGQSTSKTYDKFVIYHLGEDKYRIVNVYTGMPLRIRDGKILTDVWISSKEGEFTLVKDDENTEWDFEPIGTFHKDECKFKCQISMLNGMMTLTNFDKM